MVAIVTGGASGIGEAVARALGATMPVAIWDLDGAAAERLAGELSGVAIAIAVDVGDRAAVDAALETTISALGLPEVLVNNAGIRDILPFLDLDLVTWDRILRVNLDGIFHCLQAFARKLVEAGRPGSVVNIASASALTGFRERNAYTASKHAVVGLTKTAAMELAEHGIRVNAVAPGFIQTPLSAHYIDDPGMVEYIESTTPLGRWGSAEEIANAVVFAAGPGASFMTGTVLAVDGGLLAGVNGRSGPRTEVS